MNKPIIPDPPKTIEEMRPRFLALVGLLIERLELRRNLDIREETVALSLIERVLWREKPDDSEQRGSKVRQYATSFQSADGSRRTAMGTGSAADDDPAESDAAAGDGDPDEDDDRAA